MRSIRQLHLYLGLFFSPTIIFFSFSGAMQTFSLHENKHPGDHHPAWIAKLAEIHKDQRLPKLSAQQAAPPQSKPEPAEGRPAPTPKKKAGVPQRESSVPLKVFVFSMAMGLISSSLLGIFMAFKY